MSFVHIVSHEPADGASPLSELPAFKAFVADIRERCAEAPVAVDLVEVGAYRGLRSGIGLLNESRRAGISRPRLIFSSSSGANLRSRPVAACRALRKRTFAEFSVLFNRSDFTASCR